MVSLTEFADPALSDLSAVDCVFLCDVPTFTPSQVARLEAVLARGGGVAIGLGPNAAANAEVYNRMLWDNGKGMLPGKLVRVEEAAPDSPGFRLTGTEEAFRRPPLDAFRDDNARAGLTSVPFRKYVVLDAPAGGVDIQGIVYGMVFVRSTGTALNPATGGSGNSACPAECALRMNAGAAIYGALILQGQMKANGTAAVIHDATVLRRLNEQQGMTPASEVPE